MWAPSSGNYQNHSEEPRALEKTVKRFEISKIFDSWSIDIFLFLMWILVSISDLFSLKATETQIRLAWGPGRSWHERWIHLWLEADSLSLVLPDSKAKWKLAAIALCSPGLYPAERVMLLFPQDSRIWLGSDFQWTESGHMPICGPITGARTMPYFDGQDLNHMWMESGEGVVPQWKISKLLPK